MVIIRKTFTIKWSSLVEKHKCTVQTLSDYLSFKFIHDIKNKNCKIKLTCLVVYVAMLELNSFKT
jgi:hypothetical protein